MKKIDFYQETEKSQALGKNADQECNSHRARGKNKHNIKKVTYDKTDDEKKKISLAKFVKQR